MNNEILWQIVEAEEIENLTLTKVFEKRRKSPAVFSVASSPRIPSRSFFFSYTYRYALKANETCRYGQVERNLISTN